MPVSINGNTGVITGVAVGGLPDGIVDADMLASGVGGKILQVVSTIKLILFQKVLVLAHLVLIYVCFYNHQIQTIKFLVAKLTIVSRVE